MSIYRTKSTVNFTHLKNEVLQDSNLSLEALGLLVYLLSMPEDWVVQHSQIQKHFNIGRDKRKRVMKELEEAGYLVRKQPRDEAGLFENYDYSVFDDPQSPATENPSTDNRSTDNQHITKDLLDKELKNTNGHSEEMTEKPDPFDDWWQHYPRKVAKGNARKPFKAALKKTDIETLMNAVKAFAKQMKGKNPEYVAHASTWLNGERWLDYKSIQKPEDDSNKTVIYLKICTEYAKNGGRWQYEEMFGPAPDKSGTNIPQDIWSDAQKLARAM